MWKHYIVLFGGFYDPGLRSKSEVLRYHSGLHEIKSVQLTAWLTSCLTAHYLNDLWLFDTQEYKWRHNAFKKTELQPS